MIAVILTGCGDLAADPSPVAHQAERANTRPAPSPEASLGVADHGIWADLDAQVQLALPRDAEQGDLGRVDGTAPPSGGAAGRAQVPAVDARPIAPARVAARVDRDHGVLVVTIDGFPRKVYPLTGNAVLRVGDYTLALRAGDREELAGLLVPERMTEGRSAHDRDGDGIPDPLDLFIGAKKELLNHEAYTQGALDYIGMRYPMGDVPRDIGVCTDVVIRAARNAGHDLQQQLHDDIRRARAAYPMVKGTGDTNIDQRRVGTLLPYFKRHWEAHSIKLGDADDPWLPGDVIFMDTYPDRPGPDHIGIVSDRLDDNGLPLVINNWSVGLVVSEMDLLAFVPVLYRFRLPS